MIASLPLLAWPRGQVLTTLVYHRVLARPDPYRTGEVAADAFADQMRFLHRHFAVLPLLEAVRLLKQERLPRRACCITFDDGYADNLTVATPILRQHGLPATVFVASGYLDGRVMFSEAVTDAIGHSPLASLDLSPLDLGVHRLESVADRQAAITAVLRKFRHRAPETRDADLQRMREICGCPAETGRLMMTREQVRQLAGLGIDIGGHTVTHPVLTSVDDDRAREELAACKRDLEGITGTKVGAFAYPNGRPDRDYSLRHVAMARDAGYEVAVTTERGVARPGGDEFQLPRFALWGRSAAFWAMRATRNAWSGGGATRLPGGRADAPAG